MPQRLEYITGNTYLFGSLFSTRTRVCADHNLVTNISTNPKGNNPFRVYHTVISGSIQNGGSDEYFRYENNPSTWYDRTHYVAKCSKPLDSIANYSNRFAAGTNPSRPAVRLPVFVAELRDIPGMVKEMGAVAIAIRDKGFAAVAKKANTATLGKANLAYQFGWRPFVQDLWKMVTFADACEKRKKELTKLSRQGLRRRWNRLDEGSESYTEFDQDLGTLQFKRSVVVKAGGIWKCSYPGSADLTPSQIRRVILGSDPGNITANVWEALPWSWFTDYFLNVGQMLQAGNQTIAYLDRGWITNVWESKCSSSGSPGWTSPGFMTFREIERYPANPSVPTASFPTLEAGQLSILGSLAVVKNRKVLLS